MSVQDVTREPRGLRMANESASSSSPRKPHEYVVVARRYRPQSFQDLVGQNQVSQALSNAITTGRVGHAYLFTGARGVGKTSTARIFAKALNCKSGPSPTPCNQCDICLSIASGEDVDVLEIDGASNRGIDEIRQLRSNVNIRPSRSRFKIYIIDEVHMLTIQAFNALLKTLEEPPEHVKFIFCTTDAEKIPITILSRCQRYDFPPVETKSIIDRLRFIVETEGIAADEEALQLLARRANGSMRDSQSLLEQLISFCPTHITVQDVHSMLGTARGGQLAGLANKLIERDAAGALKELDAALAEGVDAGQLTEQLVGYFRDMLAATVGCGPDLLLHTMSAEYPQLQQSGQSLGVETMLAVVQILDQSIGRMRYSTHVRTLLELAVVRIARLENLDELAEVVAQLRQGGSAPPARATVTQRATTEKKNDLSRAPQPATEPSAISTEKLTDVLGGSPAVSLESSAASSIVGDIAVQNELTAETVDSIWKEALADLGDMTADFARHAESIQLSGPDHLVASFRAGYTLHKEYCERPERRIKLEAALAKVAGRRIRLDLELLPGDARLEPRPPAVQTNRQRFQERQRQPLVRQAIEMFDGEVTRIDEPRVAEERGG